MTGVEFPGDASSVCERKTATEADPVKVRETYPGNQSSKGAEARAFARLDNKLLGEAPFGRTVTDAFSLII